MTDAKAFHAMWQHWQDVAKNEEGPIIVCVPPGVHYRYYPKRNVAEQFSREDELICRQSIYGLSEEEARWDEPRTETPEQA